MYIYYNDKNEVIYISPKPLKVKGLNVIFMDIDYPICPNYKYFLKNGALIYKEFTLWN